MVKLKGHSRARIPKNTKISGSRWRIICRRNVTLNGEKCDGVCHFNHHVIEVSVENGDDYSILTNFWHEIFHALIFESGVELTDNEEHAIIKQAEKYLAANVDFRDKPRVQKKREGTITNSNNSADTSQKKKRDGSR